MNKCTRTEITGVYCVKNMVMLYIVCAVIIIPLPSCREFKLVQLGGRGHRAGGKGGGLSGRGGRVGGGNWVEEWGREYWSQSLGSCGHRD